MIVVDEARVFTMIIKLIEAVFFIIMSNQIRNKNRDYILNKFFSWTFNAWAIYLCLDSIVYFIVPQSYQWYIVAQIISGIEFVLLFTYCFLLLNSARIIKDGQTILKKKGQMALEILVLAISVTIYIMFTRVSVLDANGQLIDPLSLPPTGDFTLIEGLKPISVAATAMAFVYYGISGYFLMSVVHKSTDPFNKRKMGLMSLGLLLIPSCLLYFVFRSLFLQDFGIWLTLPGHLMSLFSPILILVSLNMKEKK